MTKDKPETSPRPRMRNSTLQAKEGAQNLYHDRDFTNLEGDHVYRAQVRGRFSLNDSTHDPERDHVSHLERTHELRRHILAFLCCSK